MQQDPELAFVEFQMVPFCPSLQPGQGLLKGCTALRGTSPKLLQLCVVSEPAEEAAGPSSQSLMNKLAQY